MTKSRNDAFAIGSFRNRSRLWVWTGRNNVLDFLEYDDKVVNELTWGDIKAGPPVAVTLHNVQFSNRGASPANASGTDIGVSRIASQLFAKMTALSWKKEGSSF